VLLLRAATSLRTREDVNRWGQTLGEIGATKEPYIDLMVRGNKLPHRDWLKLNNERHGLRRAFADFLRTGAFCSVRLRLPPPVHARCCTCSGLLLALSGPEPMRRHVRRRRKLTYERSGGIRVFDPKCMVRPCVARGVRRSGGRALQEGFVDLADVRSCINVSGF
jgi:hypothetical protein